MVLIGEFGLAEKGRLFLAVRSEINGGDSDGLPSSSSGEQRTGQGRRRSSSGRGDLVAPVFFVDGALVREHEGDEGRLLPRSVRPEEARVELSTERLWRRRG